MPENFFAFDEGTAKRILVAMAWFERHAQNLPGLPESPVIDSNMSEDVRVTSTTQVDGRYPGRIQTYDAVTKVWSDLAAADDCWVVGKNGETLTTTKYGARRWGNAGSPDRPVFTVVPAGGTTGVTGGRTLYRYSCVDNQLTEASAAVTLADGVATAWASSYT